MRIADPHPRTRQEQINGGGGGGEGTKAKQMTLKQNFKAGFDGVEEKATSFIAPTKGQDL